MAWVGERGRRPVGEHRDHPEDRERQQRLDKREAAHLPHGITLHAWDGPAGSLDYPHYALRGEFALGAVRPAHGRGSALPMNPVSFASA